MKQGLLAVFLFLTGALYAQSSETNLKVYARSPVWIKMMDDPSVNYFEAVNAYNVYWKHHEKPIEERQIIGKNPTADEVDKHQESWFSRLFGSREKREGRSLAFECKKFEHWKMLAEPYVQPDGRILNAEERLEIWKKSRP